MLYQAYQVQADAFAPFRELARASKDFLNNPWLAFRDHPMLRHASATCEMVSRVGITPRRYEPHEFPALLSLGIGFTDVCKLGSGMDHQALAFPVDIPAFREKMQRYQPKIIAFTSKKAASLFYGRPTKAIALGRQPSQQDFPDVFVLASPSGAASGSWTVQPWQELADTIA